MNDRSESSLHIPLAVIVLASGVILLGVAKMPYGYYTLLRIVATAVFVWAAFVSHSRQHQALPWVFGFAAILFNPVIRIHLDRSIWVWANIGAGVLLLASAQHLVRRR